MCVLLVSLKDYVYIHTAIIYTPLVFPFSSLFCLCHNLCGPGKTALLLRVLWAEREYRAEGVIDVSLGRSLGFITLPIKSIRKIFYYPERYVQIYKT